MTREQQERIEKYFDELCENVIGLNLIISDEFLAALKVAYVAGAEYAFDTAPCWISVEDELPHAEQDNATNLGAFLFYTEPIDENGSFEGRYRTGFYDSVTGTYKIRPNHFGNTRVTHWMPLPQPPKKGGDK